MLRLQTPLPERYRDATPEALEEMIGAAKATLGSRVFILGHHYQRNEVMRWADARGDSYRLSVLAQERPDADYIVFCGVHFMAESADILTGDHKAVILPDINAGCSMADMANLDEVSEAWEELGEVIDTSSLMLPVPLAVPIAPPAKLADQLVIVVPAGALSTTVAPQAPPMAQATSARR